MSPIVLMIAVAGAIGFVLIALVVRTTRDQKAQREAATDELRSLGLDFVEKPDAESRQEAFAPFNHLVKRLQSGEKGVKWHASGTIDGQFVRLMKHEYTTMAGQTPVQVTHHLAAVESPPQWPTLSLSGEHALHKVADFFGHKDIQVESEAFNKRWRIKSDDEDFAILFLNPAVQEFLTKASSKEAWRIGHGQVCCIHQGSLKADEMMLFATRPAHVMALIPPELEAWTSPGN